MVAIMLPVEKVAVLEDVPDSILEGIPSNNSVTFAIIDQRKIDKTRKAL